MVPVNNGKMADLIALLPEHWSMSTSASFFADGGRATRQADVQLPAITLHWRHPPPHHHQQKSGLFVGTSPQRDVSGQLWNFFASSSTAVKEEGFPVHNKSLALFILNPTISIWLNLFDHQPLHSSRPSWSARGGGCGKEWTTSTFSSLHPIVRRIKWLKNGNSWHRVAK